MTTYYDILGIVPGSDAMTINKAYNAAIRAQLDPIDYPRGSMWWLNRLQKIAELTDAMNTLCSTDRREVYHQKLAGAGLVCSLCDGMGSVKYGKGSFDKSSRELTCSACKGTGKGFELPEDTQ